MSDAGGLDITTFETRYHRLGMPAKPDAFFFSAWVVNKMVSGPSRSHTKSIASSRSVRSGRAAGCVPVIMMRQAGLIVFSARQVSPAADMFWVDADGWKP